LIACLLDCLMVVVAVVVVVVVVVCCFGTHQPHPSPNRFRTALPPVRVVVVVVVVVLVVVVDVVVGVVVVIVVVVVVVFVVVVVAVVVVQTAFAIVVQGIDDRVLLDESVPVFLAMCEHSSRLIASQPTVAVSAVQYYYVHGRPAASKPASVAALADPGRRRCRWCAQESSPHTSASPCLPCDRPELQSRSRPDLGAPCSLVRVVRAVTVPLPVPRGTDGRTNGLAGGRAGLSASSSVSSSTSSPSSSSPPPRRSFADCYQRAVHAGGQVQAGDAPVQPHARHQHDHRAGAGLPGVGRAEAHHAAAGAAAGVGAGQGAVARREGKHPAGSRHDQRLLRQPQGPGPACEWWWCAQR
jgi:hypothetical protein